MSCFIAGDMKGLTNNQRVKYSMAENTFLRIQAYDTDIRTKRLAGNKTLSYYVFKEGEQVLYKQGQYLLVQNDAINEASYRSVVKV